MFSGNKPKSLQACLQLYGIFKLIAYFQSQAYCVIDKDSEKGELAVKILVSLHGSSGPAWY
tara:strand:+ start:192 stop:374 length:183 start_codon:yes stop_codon:yes gene_type:complete